MSNKCFDVHERCLDKVSMMIQMCTHAHMCIHMCAHTRTVYRTSSYMSLPHWLNIINITCRKQALVVCQSGDR